MEEKKTVYRRTASPAGRPERPGALLVLFCAMLFGFALLNLFWPKRQVSELENRRLAGAPAFSAANLSNGRWTAGLGSYMQDQVPGRDALLWLESAARAVGLQQAGEGGILLGRDGWMFTEQFAVSDTVTGQLERNLAAVEQFTAQQAVPVTFLLAPSAAVIYPEMLPAGAPMIDEGAMLDDIFAHVQAAGASVLDLRGEFTANKADYLYYKTDHHWTTQGAYLAYRQFCALRGLAPFDADAAQRVEVPGFYGTHYSATRRWNVQPDTLWYYPLPYQETVYEVTGEAQFTPKSTGPLVAEEKLAGRDKYGAFLGGNNGYTTIEGSGEGSILVVKDSYANCFVPFLTENYKKIGVVDFRGYSYGPDSLIRQEGYDEVLILYNFQTFIADTGVVNFARPSTLPAA